MQHLFEVKSVKIHAYLPKWAASIDPWTNDLNHCVSLTCKHPIVKRVNTNLYSLSNAGCRGGIPRRGLNMKSMNSGVVSLWYLYATVYG